MSTCQPIRRRKAAVKRPVIEPPTTRARRVGRVPADGAMEDLSTRALDELRLEYCTYPFALQLHRDGSTVARR
jgi:hypothetical protein